jgi:hypothetical protein
MRTDRRRTLVFAVPTLDLLVLALLHLSLEHARTLRLVEAGDLEYLGRVQPRVRAAAHDRDTLAYPMRTREAVKISKVSSGIDIHFIDGNTAVRRLRKKPVRGRL